MNTLWYTLRLTLALLLVAGILSCLFSFFLPPSAALLAPTATLTPTITPTPTATSTLTATVTPLPPEMVTPVEEYGAYTVYWKRDLWEEAVGKSLMLEDFESDPSADRTLDLPYITGSSLLLTGQGYPEIIQSAQLLPSGKYLHFRDWEQGITLTLPKTKQATAFGFNYTTPEVWRLHFNSVEVTMPSGRNSFLGIVLHQGVTRAVTFSCSEYYQGGLSVDNISYVP